jgi:hypothetical protein
MVASEQRLGPARRRSTRPPIPKPELISNDPETGKDKLTALQRRWHTKKKREDGAHLGILKLSMLAVARQPPHLADLARGAWDKRSLSIQGWGKRRDDDRRFRSSQAQATATSRPAAAREEEECGGEEKGNREQG